jgi:hypothetical protein
MNQVTTPDDGKLGRAEPLLSVAGITAGVTALISLAVSFGFELSQDQQLSLMGVVAVLAPLAVALIARNKVYSPASVDAIEAVALATPAPDQLIPEHAPAGLWDGGDVGLEEDLVALEAMAVEETATTEVEDVEIENDADDLDELPIKDAV